MTFLKRPLTFLAVLILLVCIFIFSGPLLIAGLTPWIIVGYLLGVAPLLINVFCFPQFYLPSSFRSAAERRPMTSSERLKTRLVHLGLLAIALSLCLPMIIPMLSPPVSSFVASALVGVVPYLFDAFCFPEAHAESANCTCAPVLDF